MIKPGETLPHLALPDLDGRPVHTQDFIGTSLLVFFWASW